MKKLLLVLIAGATMAQANAQRISNMTAEGKPSCVPFAAFNPTNNSETVLGDGQIVFPAGTDLSNVNVTLNVGTAATITEPNPLPTDWTTTVSGIKVVDNVADNKWAKYNITAKVIKPAPLPLEIKTGSGNFDSNSWTTATVGWAGAAIDKNQSLIRLGSAKRSFIVAFTNEPDSLYYTIKALGTWEGSNNVFDVDGSADGITWTSIKQYNATETMPPSSPAVVAKIKLNNNSFRYIRWIYTTRNAAPGNFNVSLEDVKVTEAGPTSSIGEKYKRQIGAYFAGNALMLKDHTPVAELAVYNAVGTQVLAHTAPQAATAVDNLPQGVYVLKMKLKNGAVVADKLLKRRL